MVTINRDAKDPGCLRLIEINDPHISANSPPAFKVSYLDYVEEQINQVFRAAIAMNVDALLWAGDLFHLKDPRNNPHWLVAQTLERFRQVAIDADLIHAGIAGNHDVRYGSITTGLKGAPLDTLIKSGHFHLLDDTELLFHLKDGYTVRVAGGSYEHGTADHVRDKKKQGADVLVCLGHFWLGTQTGEFFGEPLFGFDYFSQSEVDIFCVGHHHEDKGSLNHHGKLFVSQGSIGLTGSHPHDLNRRPAAALIEITPTERLVKMLRPKPIAASDLLDLEKRDQIRKEREEVDEFIEALKNAQMASTDPMALLDEMAPPEQVKAKVIEYLTAAEQSQ